MKEKLHHYHLAPTMYMIQTGIVFFSLPRLTAECFGTNGWISLLIFSLIAAFNIFLISLVYRLGKGQSIFDILENALPTWLLYPLYIFLIIIWVMLGSLVSLEFSQIYQMMSFSTTSPFLIHFFMMLLSFLLIRKGIYNMIKATVIFFFVTLWLVLLLFFYFPEFDWLRFTPFIFQGETKIVKGSFEIYTAFLGYELFLLFFPYVDPKAKFSKAMYSGHFYTTFIFTITCIGAFGFHSFPQLLRSAFPLLDLLAYAKFPFVERIESFALTFFLFKIVTKPVFYYWSAQEALQRLVPRIQPKWLTALIVGGAYMTTFRWPILRETQVQLETFARIEIGIAFGLPLLLLFILLIQKAKRRNAHA